MAATAAYDALDDLGALDNPDAPGIRGAFRDATLDAIERAGDAHRTARRATSKAHRDSLHAAELADRFGLAVAAALEARDDLEAAAADALEARIVLQQSASRQAEAALLSAEDEAARRLGFTDAEALFKVVDEAGRRLDDRSPVFDTQDDLDERWASYGAALDLKTRIHEATERERNEYSHILGEQADLQRAYETGHTRDEYLKILDRIYPGRRERGLALRREFEAGVIDGASAASSQREVLRLYPGPTAEALKIANDRISYANAAREVAVAKVEAAEDLRRQAMTAHRTAAETWRALLID